MNKKQTPKRWDHPGGKLIELGPAAMTDEELLAVLIGSGHNGRTALDISKDMLDNFYSIAGLLGKTSSDLSKIKGLKQGKISRIAAAFEIAKRICEQNRWTLPNRRLIRLELPGSSDVDILSVLIGSGHKGISPKRLSEKLLEKYKTIARVMGQKLSDMARIEGLGDVKIVRIAAAFETAARIVRALEKE